MGDRFELLERLRELLGLGRDGAPDADPVPPRPPYADELPPDCDDVEEVACEEAARRVYAFLDGELDEEDAEAIRCHVEQCERCFPMYNWEWLFLDVLKERGDRPEPSDELRKRVTELLDRESA
ncbi:MAG: zf-HC2 domain-containing protein [Gemmatimonadota bacterium]